MKILLTLVLLLASCVISCAPTNISAEPAPPAPPRKTMRAFRTERELRGYFRQLSAKYKRIMRERQVVPPMAYSTATANAAAPSTTMNNSMAEGPTGLFTVYDGESITNTQHAGVDEGGIVKVHGKHLVDTPPWPPVYGRNWRQLVDTCFHHRRLCSGNRSEEHLVRRDAGFRRQHRRHRL